MDVSRRRDIGAIVRVMCEMEPSVYVMCFPFWVCIGQILNIPVLLYKGLLLCPLKLVAYGTSEYICPNPMVPWSPLAQSLFYQGPMTCKYIFA